MEDLLEQVNEIQESLGRSYAVPDEIDEADLQAELDALELEEEEEDFLSPPSSRLLTGLRWWACRL